MILLKVTQLFDDKKCMESGCGNIWVCRGISTCYGIPEECEFNRKNGFPKEVDESEMVSYK